jgi:YfiH family protein
MTMKADPGWIVPSWPAPAHVRALSTTRQGGVSGGPYGLAGGRPGGLNLGSHVGDDADAVARNRERLAAALPSSPRWLEQVHGCAVVTVEPGAGLDSEEAPRADASIAAEAGQVCAVMTADCLPVLLCDRAGTVVGAAHAGWRGLCAGVIEATLDRMSQRAHGRAGGGAGGSDGNEWLAWLGPAIGPDAFEVGAEVRAAFLDAALPHEREAVERAFRAGAAGKYFADIYQLAMTRLARAGCTQVFGADRCTVAEAETFYSYRRDGTTGRMASLIWLAPRA